MRFYGLVQWQKYIAIITEYLSNGNLMELLRDEDVEVGPFLQLRMGYQIANGLAFLHNLLSDQRLVHGDLKAENVLLNDDLICKIADFGSSVLSNYTGKATLKKADGNHRNEFTKIYAAPELLVNNSMKLRTSNDVYSFAMILYLILTRRNPVTNESVLNVYFDDIKKGKRPNIDIYNLLSKLIGCKTSFNSVLLLYTVTIRCWVQDASKRPKILTVKDELQNQLVEIEPHQIHSQVTRATAKLMVAKLSRTKFKCVAIDRVPEKYLSATLSGFNVFTKTLVCYIYFSISDSCCLDNVFANIIISSVILFL